VKKLLVTAFALLLASPMFAVDTKEMASRYKGKFAVVAKEGLAFGVFESSTDHVDFPIRMDIIGDEAVPKGSFPLVPIHKGEIVQITGAGARHDVAGVVIAAGPHQVERGIGAYAHQSVESGSTSLVFKVGKAATIDQFNAELSKWLTVYDTQEQAAAAVASVGNTAAGVYVNEVKLGMSAAEVESVLGVPVTRVDLGPKLLYKYKDMTVEFHDGKVTDVR
jgi:hypothetical protein